MRRNDVVPTDKSFLADTFNATLKHGLARPQFSGACVAVVVGTRAGALGADADWDEAYAIGVGHCLEPRRVQASRAASDIGRRRKVFRSSRDSAEFPLVVLNDTSMTYAPRGEGVLHVGLIVGPRGFEHYSGTEIGLPVGNHYLEAPLPTPLLDRRYLNWVSLIRKIPLGAVCEHFAFASCGS